MARPRKARCVAASPTATYYKPRGIPLVSLNCAVLPVEGLEALRLADAEALEHAEAARQMGVSRPTFSRLLAESRRIVANALVNGWALRIDGGDFRLVAGEGAKPICAADPGGAIVDSAHEGRVADDIGEERQG
jgi:uncharacterized protein